MLTLVLVRFARLGHYVVTDNNDCRPDITDDSDCKTDITDSSDCKSDITDSSDCKFGITAVSYTHLTLPTKVSG